MNQFQQMMEQMRRMQQLQQQQQNNTSTSGNQQQAATGASQPVGFSAMSKLSQFAFIFLTIYIIYIGTELQNPNSILSVAKGMKFWQLAPDSVACYLLVQTLLPKAQQEELHRNFVTASAREPPTYTFAQFVRSQYPTILQGTTVTQDQIIAAVAACVASSNNTTVARKLQESNRFSVGSSSSPAASVDKAMLQLRTDYPQIFAAR